MSTPHTRPSPKGALRDYFETIVVCVIFVLFGRAFVFQQSKIPTGSMEETLLVGDYIMVNKFLYGPAPTFLERALLPFQEVRRGDVIVFKFPDEPEKDYIKRVVALPGDMLEIIKRQVYINGEPLEESYKLHRSEHVYGSSHVFPEDFCRSRDHCGPVKISANKFFAMGDNRDSSRDSRSWGLVPRDYIKGRAFMIWWSFEERRNQYMETGFSNWAKHVAEKITHVIDKTRWKRMFRIIR
jgi:signal peptidase I